MIRRVSHILIKRACFFGVFALAVMLSLFFVGCDPNGPDHIHDWGDWVETTPATCTAPGVETRICKENANHTETRSIAQLSGSQCGSGNGGDDSFTDTRNSQTYKTVKIGNQTWMAENLNYAGSGGNTGVCYNSSSDNCSKYGRLYTWAEVMNGASSSLLNPSGVQGVCPVGWHVPSDAEWTILTDFVGGDLTAGTKLKSKTGWGSYQGISSTDEYGFSALPGGFRLGDPGGFSYAGNTGCWWSATEGDADRALYRDIFHNAEFVRLSWGYKADSYSVRCVKDN